MNYLVLCPCSHSLEAHSERGCQGDRGGCACPLAASGALVKAVEAARSTYMRQFEGATAATE